MLLLTSNSYLNFCVLIDIQISFQARICIISHPLVPHLPESALDFVVKIKSVTQDLL